MVPLVTRPPRWPFALAIIVAHLLLAAHVMQRDDERAVIDTTPDCFYVLHSATAECPVPPPLTETLR